MTELMAAPATLSGPTPEKEAAELQEIVSQLRAEFAQRDALYKDIDAVVFGELEPDIPDAYRKTAKVVKSPLAGHITNTVTAALSVDRPKTQFVPTGFGDRHEQNATRRERFNDASFLRQEEEARRQLFRLFIYSLVSKGEGVLKTVERSKSAWESYDRYSVALERELREGREYRDLDEDGRSRVYDRATEEYKLRLPYPIRCTDVPPDQFYYLKGEEGFTLCAEVKTVPYHEALARFPGFAVGKSGNVVPQAMGLPRADWQAGLDGKKGLLLTEVWRWDKVTYILQGPAQKRGIAVRTLKHGYGDAATKTLRGPYHHALGITTASRLPEYAGLGVLFGFLPLFPLLNSLLTMEAQIAYMYGFPSFKRKRSATDPLGGAVGPYGNDGTEDKDAGERIQPGYIYPDDIEPVQQPTGNEAVERLIGLTRGMLELALPSVVQGVVSGDESGYALNQAAHLARLAWDPIVGNAQAALAQKAGFESYLIERCIGETVYVWDERQPVKGRRSNKAGWLGLGPDDVNGVYRYKVVLDPQTPSNKIMEQRYWEGMVKAGFATPEDAINAMGGNPDEVERGLLLGKVKAHPSVQEQIVQRAFQRLGTVEQQKVQQVQGPQGMGADPLAALGNMGQVFAPGQGMPLAPTPQGAVTGMGPAGAGGGGGSPVPGMPINPNLPARHLALPGEM